MSRLRNFRLVLAYWSLLVGGLVLTLDAVFKWGEERDKATESLAVGLLCLAAWILWTWIQRRRHAGSRKDSSATTRDSTNTSPSEADQKAAFIASIPALAAMHIEKAQSIFDRTLAYEPEAFAATDEIITEGWGGAPPAMENTIVPFGAFVGEAIRHLHGGEWGYSEEDGFFLEHVGGEHGMKIFPFAKVRKRFVNGEEDSLAFYYQVIQQQLENPEGSS